MKNLSNLKVFKFTFGDNLLIQMQVWYHNNFQGPLLFGLPQSSFDFVCKCEVLSSIMLLGVLL